jgi:hypothetical protein
MLVEQGSRIVTASVAPVVVVSACGLLCLAFYNRLAAIVSRLRAFQRERLAAHERIDQLRAANPADPEGPAVERHRRVLDTLAQQTAGVFRRARLIRLTLLCLLGAIAALVLSSVCNGLALVWPGAMMAAAGFFLGGMALLLAGVTAAAIELFTALDVAELESVLVDELTHADGSSPQVALLTHGNGAAR